MKKTIPKRGPYGTYAKPLPIFNPNEGVRNACPDCERQREECACEGFAGKRYKGAK